MKNIVIIIIDAFRAKNSSLFGYERETNKNLKILMKESFLFKQHFSVSNATLPSLTSLFTGKYPYNHGIIHSIPYTKQEEYDKLKKSTFWFPSYLKKKGYETIGIDWIGVWLKKGFDYYGGKEEEKSRVKEFIRSPFIKKILLGMPGWIYKLGKKVVKARSSRNFPRADELIDLTISKVKESKKPFFLFVHYIDSHFPYLTMKNPKSTGKNDIKEVLKSIKSDSQREYVKKRIVDVGLNSTEDIKKKYDLAIRNTDEQLGRLMNFLKESKMWKDTIFIVLADHGVSLTEHGIYFSQAGLYDETIHVPLIMKIPGFKGGEIEELVQNIDIVPTIMDNMKWGKRKDFDGKSMLNLIKRNNPIRNKVLSFDGLAEDVKSVRTKKRKLILAKNGRCNLCKAKHHDGIEEYDLKKDPNELKNIYSGKSELKKFVEKI